MDLRKFIFPLIISVLTISGCGSFSALATTTPTAPPHTPTLTETPHPTPTSTLQPSPTPVFANYPWKHVWIKLTVTSPLDTANQFQLLEEPLFIVYTDGQVIVADAKNSSIRTRYLNTRQICSLIDYLDELGVYALEDQPATDETNPVYDFGENFKAVDDGRVFTLTINESMPHQVSFFEPYRDFLRRPMRKAVEYLETYNPGGFAPYQPDRLILFVRAGRDGAVNEKAKPQLWKLGSLTLNELSGKPYTLLEGAQAADVYEQIAKSENGFFLEDEVEYTVTVRLLYPHEIVNVGSVPVATPTESLLPVNCKP